MERRPPGQAGIALDVSSRTVDASENSSRARVSSVMVTTVFQLVSETGRTSSARPDTKDRASGDEHHGTGDPPPVEFGRHQRVAHDDDRENGETTHQIPLPRGDLLAAGPGPSRQPAAAGSISRTLRVRSASQSKVTSCDGTKPKLRPIGRRSSRPGLLPGWPGGVLAVV